MKTKLLIFDMDNTLLHSRIDFALMKQEVGRMLDAAGIYFDYHRPVSDNLSALLAEGQLSQSLNQKIWQRISEIESDGLAAALLEPGVEAVLRQLSAQFQLAVLSNNMDLAVHQCLHQLAVAQYFSLICGREAVPALKPRPDGVRFICQAFPHVPVQNTWMIGDALIDAQAAFSAGIGFIAYNRSRDEDWRKTAGKPQLYLHRWDEAATAAIVALAAERDVADGDVSDQEK